MECQGDVVVSNNPRRCKGISRSVFSLLIWFSTILDFGQTITQGISDRTKYCDHTKLMCNESRLLEEDKVIILNIANDMRNTVAGGNFKYLNLRHDPVSNMNKLSWDEELARKATYVVSHCPKTTQSFINEETFIQRENGIDLIKIKNSFVPSHDKPSEKIPGCDVTTITYSVKLNSCTPQKIKERLIAYLIEGGLSDEGRKYDMRDFRISIRHGEPKLTFRRVESSNLGCGYMIRVGETHYNSYLTCIYCSYNATVPIIGHSGEECPEEFPNLDEKYEHLCSDSKNEYEHIEKDVSNVICNEEREEINTESPPQSLQTILITNTTAQESTTQLTLAINKVPNASSITFTQRFITTQEPGTEPSTPLMPKPILTSTSSTELTNLIPTQLNESTPSHIGSSTSTMRIVFNTGSTFLKQISFPCNASNTPSNINTATDVIGTMVNASTTVPTMQTFTSKEALKSLSTTVPTMQTFTSKEALKSLSTTLREPVTTSLLSSSSSSIKSTNSTSSSSNNSTWPYTNTGFTIQISSNATTTNLKPISNETTSLNQPSTTYNFSIDPTLISSTIAGSTLAKTLSNEPTSMQPQNSSPTTWSTYDKTTEAPGLHSLSTFPQPSTMSSYQADTFTTPQLPNATTISTTNRSLSSKVTSCRTTSRKTDHLLLITEQTTPLKLSEQSTSSSCNTERSTTYLKNKRVKSTSFQTTSLTTSTVSYGTTTTNVGHLPNTEIISPPMETPSSLFRNTSSTHLYGRNLTAIQLESSTNIFPQLPTLDSRRTTAPVSGDLHTINTTVTFLNTPGTDHRQKLTSPFPSSCRTTGSSVIYNTSSPCPIKTKVPPTVPHISSKNYTAVTPKNSSTTYLPASTLCQSKKIASVTMLPITTAVSSHWKNISIHYHSLNTTTISSSVFSSCRTTSRISHHRNITAELEKTTSRITPTTYRTTIPMTRTTILKTETTAPHSTYLPSSTVTSLRTSSICCTTKTVHYPNISIKLQTSRPITSRTYMTTTLRTNDLLNTTITSLLSSSTCRITKTPQTIPHTTLTTCRTITPKIPYLSNTTILFSPTLSTCRTTKIVSHRNTIPKLRTTSNVTQTTYKTTIHLPNTTITTIHRVNTTATRRIPAAHINLTSYRTTAARRISLLPNTPLASRSTSGICRTTKAVHHPSTTVKLQASHITSTINKTTLRTSRLLNTTITSLPPSSTCRTTKITHHPSTTIKLRTTASHVTSTPNRTTPTTSRLPNTTITSLPTSSTCRTPKITGHPNTTVKFQTTTFHITPTTNRTTTTGTSRLPNTTTTSLLTSTCRTTKITHPGATVKFQTTASRITSTTNRTTTTETSDLPNTKTTSISTSSTCRTTKAVHHSSTTAASYITSTTNRTITPTTSRISNTKTTSIPTSSTCRTTKAIHHSSTTAASYITSTTNRTITPTTSRISNTKTTSIPTSSTCRTTKAVHHSGTTAASYITSTTNRTITPRTSRLPNTAIISQPTSCTYQTAKTIHYLNTTAELPTTGYNLTSITYGTTTPKTSLQPNTTITSLPNSSTCRTTKAVSNLNTTTIYEIVREPSHSQNTTVAALLSSSSCRTTTAKLPITRAHTIIYRITTSEPTYQPNTESTSPSIYSSSRTSTATPLRTSITVHSPNTTTTLQYISTKIYCRKNISTAGHSLCTTSVPPSTSSSCRTTSSTTHLNTAAKLFTYSTSVPTSLRTFFSTLVPSLTSKTAALNMNKVPTTTVQKPYSHLLSSVGNSSAALGKLIQMTTIHPPTTGLLNTSKLISDTSFSSIKMTSAYSVNDEIFDKWNHTSFSWSSKSHSPAKIEEPLSKYTKKFTCMPRKIYPYVSSSSKTVFAPILSSIQTSKYANITKFAALSSSLLTNFSTSTITHSESKNAESVTKLKSSSNIPTTNYETESTVRYPFYTTKGHGPSVERHRPCICINWYVIFLIFTVAFLFAWCLQCWQRVLLF